MIYIALLATSLMLGASVRTAKLPDKPIDYEVSIGIENPNAQVWSFYERENGINYTGVDLSLKSSVKRIENKIFFKNRQAKNILRGGISTSLIVAKYGRIGISNVWDHYDPAATGLLGFSSKVFTAQINVYQEGLESASLKIQKDFKLSKHISISPFYKYSIDRKKNEFMQGKVVLKLKG